MENRTDDSDPRKMYVFNRFANRQAIGRPCLGGRRRISRISSAAIVVLVVLLLLGSVCLPCANAAGIASRLGGLKRIFNRNSESGAEDVRIRQMAEEQRKKRQEDEALRKKEIRYWEGVYRHFGKPYRPALLRFLADFAVPTERKTDSSVDPDLNKGTSEADAALLCEDKYRSMLAWICEDENYMDDSEDEFTISDAVHAERMQIFDKLLEQMTEPPEDVSDADRNAFQTAAKERFARAFAVFRRDVQGLTLEDVTDNVAKEIFLDALGLPRLMRQRDCKNYVDTMYEKYLASDLIPGLPANDPEEKERLVKSFIYGKRINRMALPVPENVIPILRDFQIKEDLFRRMKDSGIRRLIAMDTGVLNGISLENDEDIFLSSCTLEMTAPMEAIDAFIDSLHQAYDSGRVYLVVGCRLSAPAECREFVPDGDWDLRIPSPYEKTAEVSEEDGGNTDKARIDALDGIVRKRLASPDRADILAGSGDFDDLRALVGTRSGVQCTLSIEYLFDSSDGYGANLLGDLPETVEDDDRFTQELLALCYSRGIGRGADPDMEKHFRKMVNEAEIHEAFQLGKKYFAYEVNLVAAAELLKKAADNGNAEAERLLKKTEEELRPAKEFLKEYDMKQAEKKAERQKARFKLTETDLGSDQDGDGFTLNDEFEADTDPTDPLSHPKYITRTYVSAVSRQRFIGLQLVSADMTKPDKKDWQATFNVVRNNRKRSEFVKINSGTFKNNNVDFSVVDMEMDEKTQEAIVFIQRVGKQERIPCLIKQDVYDPVVRVRFQNGDNTFISSVGAEFTLGTDKTGEERYKLLSADSDKKEVVVESVGNMSKKFTIRPAPKQ